MRRSPIFSLLLICLLVAPASAYATVTAEGSESQITVTSDGGSDAITVECVGGMAPSGGVSEIPCANVNTIIVQGGAGEDTINLASVSKTKFPTLGFVEIDGGTEADSITGTQIGDTIEADFADTVNGVAGNDSIEGGDDVSGGEGDDVMAHVSGIANGGPGDDRVEDPAGPGPTSGGPGSDAFAFNLPAEATLTARFDVEDGGLGVSTASESIAFFWNSIDRVELSLVDGGTQTVDASKFSGVLEADGRGGPDILIGSPGEDLLSGGPGNDELTGGPGFDRVRGDVGSDQLRLRDGEADRGVCGDDSDTVIADLADSLAGCESIDLPAAVVSPTVTPSPVAPIAGVPDTTAPDTKGLKGPKKTVQGKAAIFAFGSSESGGTFKCRVDKGPVKLCRSPYKVKTGALDPDKQHTFSVFAIDAAGNADRTPATLRFSVVEKPAPRRHG